MAKWREISIGSGEIAAAASENRRRRHQLAK